MQLKKIIEKVFRLEHDESVCSTIDPNGNRVEYKIDYYTLWKPGIVPNYKIEKKIIQNIIPPHSLTPFLYL